MRLSFLIGLAGLASACPETTEPTDSAEPTDCASLSTEACAAATDCGLVDAQPLQADDAGGFCLPEGTAYEPVGCLDAGRTCTTALTGAVDAQGNGWLFRDGCIPEGFTESGQPFGQPCAPDCAAVSPSACAGTPGCRPIEGLPLQDDGKGDYCLDFSVVLQTVGCLEAKTGCGDAETYATAPDGRPWWFSDTCVPDSYTKIGFDAAPKCP